ncbi:S8 family peptidase [Micrococcoides hystricis]|uniref:S8 family serine peptidase n=1 Tax=Micrococcoides hystricis TaxID=1572761 RepID=A0ABV6P939_9MICC
MTKRFLTRLGALLVIATVALGALVSVPSTAHADQWRDDQFWLDDYKIKEAWKTSKGKGVKVAVIDSGIDDEHPDLKGVVTGGKDFSGVGNDDGTKPVGEAPQHGTLVGTVLAGRGNNKKAIAKAKKERAAEIKRRKDENDDTDDPLPKVPKPGPGPDGVIGIAPEAELLSISVFLGRGNPTGVSIEEQIPQAVRWAVDNGAKVINMSLGSNKQDWPKSWDEAFLYAEEKDVVVVAAAGNRASGALTVGAPATIPGVLTVAGLDEDGLASWDSSSEGISIGVSAPAEPLVGGLPGGGYSKWAGTSGAAPFVAGVAALIRAENPDMSAPQVIQRILATAKDEGKDGVDTIYGHGIIQPVKALTADVDEVDRNPMDTMAEWIRVHRRGEEPSPQVTEPEFKPGEKVAAAPTPQAKPNLVGHSDEQAPLVIGFGTGLGLILLGGALHISMRLRERKAAATTPPRNPYPPQRP